MECRQCVQNGVKTVYPIPNRGTVENAVRSLLNDKKLYRDMFSHGLTGYDIPYTEEECLFLANPDTCVFHDYLTGEDGSECEDLLGAIDNVMCISIDMAKDRIPNTWDIGDNADPVQFVLDMAKRK